jgi:hypothetical protein
MEIKVRKALEKRDSLLEILDKKIRALEGELDKARSLRAKLSGSDKPQTVTIQSPANPGPLKGFRSSGIRPAEAQLDTLIRQGKL